ncbi:MAG: hypothetical protein JNL09_07945 [Anaerolineales bacterium]|nr:hypothetical protein [Anaerolineales bacterium]
MTNQIHSNPKWANNFVTVLRVLLLAATLLYVSMFSFRWAASSLPAYVFCMAAGLGLAAWASYTYTTQWMGRLIFGVLSAVLFGSLLLLPFRYSNYQQPAGPASGYPLVWASQPTNTVIDAFKQFQLAFEIQCDFSLLGWTEAGNLQYTSACQPGVWTYSSATQTSTWALFNFDTPSKAITRWDGQQYLAQPAGLLERDFPFLTLERATAPNGQWEAVVVRWFYGPSDVLLISTQ